MPFPSDSITLVLQMSLWRGSQDVEKGKLYSTEQDIISSVVYFF